MESHSQHSMGPACGLNLVYTGHEIISCEKPLLYVGVLNNVQSIRQGVSGRKGSSYELAAA